MTIPDNDFGRRVRERLRDEHVIWFTTTGADGTPQPNPVWFLWSGGDEVLIYNDIHAKRLEHVAVRPRVSLHFDSDGSGGDVIVFVGVAEQALDEVGPDRNAAYREKYARGIAALGNSAEEFGQRYAVPLRVRFTQVRGF